MKKTIIILTGILALILSYYFGINYLVFETGKGRPITEKHKLSPKNNNTSSEGVIIVLSHLYPLVDLSDCQIGIEGVISGDLLYFDNYQENIKIPKVPENEPIRFIVFKDDKEYVYGSKSGYSGNSKKLKAKLFLNYSDKYLGWYKLEE